MRALARALGAVGLATLLAASCGDMGQAAGRRPLFASNGCNIAQPTLAFPAFNPLLGTDSTTTGTFTVTCLLPETLTIALGTGGSNSFATRLMTNGTGTIKYNLYTTAQMNVVWGDGTGTTQTRSVTSALDIPGTLTIYGDVPAVQNVAAGTYTDAIGITITLL